MIQRDSPWSDDDVEIPSENVLEKAFQQEIDLYAAAMATGVKHPLSPFAKNLPLTPERWKFFNMLMTLIRSALDHNPKLAAQAEHSEYFLLHDNERFPLVCDLAGIDAEKLRNHLLELSIAASLDALEETL